MVVLNFVLFITCHVCLCLKIYSPIERVVVVVAAVTVVNQAV